MGFTAKKFRNDFCTGYLKLNLMKKIFLLSLGVLLMASISSCSSTKIDYDKNTDFSQYKTFAFFKKGIVNLNVPASKKKFILKAISQALLNKGFTKSSHPDFIVNVFTDLHKRIDVYPGYFPYRRHISKSIEGDFYMDIVDIKTKKVVWTGKTYLDLSGNDYKAFRRAIAKLLAKFPPEKE